jgi:hypothetical protein
MNDFFSPAKRQRTLKMNAAAQKTTGINAVKRIVRVAIVRKRKWYLAILARE